MELGGCKEELPCPITHYQLQVQQEELDFACVFYFTTSAGRRMKHLGQRFPNFSRQITWEPQNADSDLSLEFKSEFLHSQQAPSDVAAAGLQTTLGGERI